MHLRRHRKYSLNIGLLGRKKALVKKYSFIRQ